MKTRKNFTLSDQAIEALSYLESQTIRVLLQSLKILFLLLQPVATFPSKLYNCLISAIQTGKKDCCCLPDKRKDIAFR